VNVKFIGNHLQNYQGTETDVAAKTDDSGSNQITNVELGWEYDRWAGCHVACGEYRVCA
jgi:hypothetical protein